jgi:hypothetical protein
MFKFRLTNCDVDIYYLSLVPVEAAVLSSVFEDHYAIRVTSTKA